MKSILSSGSLFRLLSRSYAVLLVLLFTTQQARSDFWTIRGKGTLQTVSLSRILPPVASRSGSTVQFLPEIAGNSIPAETAVILREKIRTLLMNTKGGAIQLVDNSPDTVIKCIVTGYEPKTIHPDQRQVGNQHLQIATWIGNIEASVQVLDKRNNPIDAANIKFHLENDYVLAQQEENVTSMTDKKTSWRDKLAGGIKTMKGGPDMGDVVGMAGGGKSMHDALAVQEKGARPPTDLEWRDALIEGLAAKVANRIVPVDQAFVAILPLDKEFAQARDLAKANHWGELQEQMEKMPPLQGASEAYRLYMLGLSYEALACSGSEAPKEAAEQLNKATKYYDDAHKLKSGEHELFLAQIRAQDSLDHYLEIEHALEAREKMPLPTATPAAESPKTAENVANNAALINMAQAKMPESVLMTYVQTVQDPQFDATANGLIELGRGNVPSNVIAAVQKRMLASTRSIRKAAPTVKHSPAVSQVH